MNKYMLCLASVLFVTPAAQAQVTIDVSKITCDQFFTMRGDPDAVAVWLGGYYHGKRGDTVVEVQEFKDNVKKLRAACRLNENRALPIMQVVEKTLAAKK